MARILIIDDEKLVRATLLQTLEKAGHEVIEAANGKDGIALYEETGADLVITDIIMPEKEGIETILDLRRDHPELKIIAISGGARIGATNHLELAGTAGAQCVLQKPFAQQDLLRAIRDTLDAAA